MKKNNLFVILGNQLFNPKKYLKDFLDCDFFMAEDFELCTNYKHHKLKILHTLSSMRSYKDELLYLGVKVHYFSLEESSFKEDYIIKLQKVIKKFQYKKIFFYEIEDKFFEEKIDLLKNTVETVILKSPMFLFNRKFFKEYLNENKPFMSSFYKLSRRKNNILLENNKPLGGKWSYDEENRKKIPKGLKAPATTSFKFTEHTLYLMPLISKYFSDHLGHVERFWLPTTREQCLAFLNNFIKYKFEKFGDYEDAISSEQDFLFHSALSPVLNIGLITPNELITIISKEQNKVKINSYEGFIRQVIGWREFIRGIYQNFEKKLINGNYFNNHRSMKGCWYEGNTGIPPLDDAIKKALRIGYNHHIERLMIISNIMNLSRINPQEVYNWFMELYVDSYDWVMAPNVFGMGLHSDGGIFATKPYICASSYWLKMSSYPKGDWTDIVDGLYWKFVDENRIKLKKNPRIGIMTKMIDNMDLERKERIFKAADNFLHNTTDD